MSCQVYALEWQDSPEIARLFNDSGTQGTFVLYDAAADRCVGFDQARVNTRFIPASTFKIANTLIGLSVGAVRNVDEALPYGGQPQPFKVWEKDMSLRQAIAASNVAIYQELARRIGLARMKDGIAKIGYGNEQTGHVVDKFWLLGPLKISALEQTQFLDKLAQKRLPFDAQLQEKVHEIIRQDGGNTWTLFGKTGWQNAPNPGVGWWVGWVTKEGRLIRLPSISISMLRSERCGQAG